MRKLGLDFLARFIRDSPFRRRYLRYNFVLALTIAILAGFSLWLSYNLRFEFQIPEEHSFNLLIVIALACVVKPILFFAFGAHKSNWRYVDVYDIEIVALSCLASSGALLVPSFFSTWLYIPRGVLFIDFVIFLILACQVRIIGRLMRETLLPLVWPGSNQGVQEAPATIIIGTGDATEALLREIRRSKTSNYDVKAIFDVDDRKNYTLIHGVRVVGKIWKIKEFVKTTRVDLAIVAIPSADKQVMQHILSLLKVLNIRIKTLPYLYDIGSGESVLLSLRDLNIIDILGREEVIVNTSQIAILIRDKVVLVTGAAGSIGSEICRQVLNYNPKKLVILDKSENLLFHLNRNLSSIAEDVKTSQVCPELCDLRDYASLKRVMVRHVPGLVLHAAAHKHVFLQELNPLECFHNNVGGMRNIVRLSDELGVESFVLISTDKAVNPSSVMGASKRICEIYCQAYSFFSNTSFMAVRFGNVLGSEGSVIPIFLEQINKGGPVTVTDPEVQRYFMTIPEAVTLVLQAAAIGAPGQIMMLDMGKPTKILDLARQLIWIAGKNEDEIPIEFIGLKPGEKLFEELSRSSETSIDTEHKKIHIWKSSVENPKETVEKIDQWLEKCDRLSDETEVRLTINGIVPEYKPLDWESPPGIIETRKEALSAIELRETSGSLAT